VDGNLFVAADAEGADGVAGFGCSLGGVWSVPPFSNCALCCGG
jgi:hypothetical protein